MENFRDEITRPDIPVTYEPSPKKGDIVYVYLTSHKGPVEFAAIITYVHPGLKCDLLQLDVFIGSGMRGYHSIPWDPSGKAGTWRER